MGKIVFIAAFCVGLLHSCLFMDVAEEPVVYIMKVGR